MKLRRFLPLIFIFALPMVANAARPALNPVDILKKSYAEDSSGVFQGKLRTTVTSGKKDTSADVRVFQSGRRMRMEYTSGPSAGTTIIDTGSSVIRLDSPGKKAYVSQISAAPKKLDLFLKNYKPTLVGSESIAGRDCYVVRVEAKHPGNPWKKLWIDKSTNLALKTERLNCEGRIVMTSTYSQVDYNARPAASLFAVPKGWTTEKVAESGGLSSSSLCKVFGFNPLMPKYVPAGYEFDGYCSTRCDKGMLIRGVQYTNGMNTISAYECPCCSGKRTNGSDGCMVGHNPNAHLVRRNCGKAMVSIVGDMDEQELQKMARSFK